MEDQTQPQDNEKRTQTFESDTHKLMRQHLEDPNHIITDEDLKKVRVGMSPGPDSPTQQAIEDADERIADSKSDSEDDTLPGAQKVTPWDTVS